MGNGRQVVGGAVSIGGRKLSVSTAIRAGDFVFLAGQIPIRNGEVVTEGKRFDVRDGDCVATGMGHHHDMPVVHVTIRAVYFETSMAGQKRRGHLWDHTHGEAQPQLDRV